MDFIKTFFFSSGLRPGLILFGYSCVALFLSACLVFAGDCFFFSSAPSLATIRSFHQPVFSLRPVEAVPVPEVSGDLEDPFSYLRFNVKRVFMEDKSRLSRLMLRGIILSDVRGAVVEDVQTREVFFLSEGDVKAELKVLQVKEGALVLRVSGREGELRFPKGEM